MIRLNLFEMKQNLSKRVERTQWWSKTEVAIVGVLLTRHDIFIADEPTSSLDRENAKRLYEVLKFYNQKVHRA